MNTLEQLEDEAFENNINIHDYYLGEENLKGIYIDGNIALNTSIETTIEKACVLAEELGHHYTSVGNILDIKDIQNQKQERQARLHGYNRMIGLYGLISAFKAGCQNRFEIAEHLCVTEEYLQECIDCYKQKYGVYTQINNYLIYFIPVLSVAEMI